MNRREFITGIFSAAAIASIDPRTLVPEATPDWALAVCKVYNDYMTNILLYGIGAIRSIDEFPYIENLNPEDIRIDIDKYVVASNGNPSLKGLL